MGILIWPWMLLLFFFHNDGTVSCVHCYYKQCRQIARGCLSWLLSWLWHLPCNVRCVGCSSDRSRKGVKAVKSEWVLAVLEVIYRNCHWAVRASEQFVVTISTAPCLCSCSTFLRLGQALVSSKVRIRMPWLTVLIIFSVDRTGRHFGCCKLCCGHKPAAHLMVMPLSIFVHAVLWCEQDK